MKNLISYEPLFQTMKRKNISTYKLFKEGINSATYYRMKEGGNVNVDTIGKLCKILNCDVQDVIKYVNDGESENDE